LASEKVQQNENVMPNFLTRWLMKEKDFVAMSWKINEKKLKELIDQRVGTDFYI